MKWFFSFILALLIATEAFAGEDLYLAIVGGDDHANPFYVSPEHLNFLYNEELFGIPVRGAADPALECTLPASLPLPERMACETFRSQYPIIQPEICDLSGEGSGPEGKDPPFTTAGNVNAKVTAGFAGWFEWFIRLPKKPAGQIGLAFQCGVVKPNAFALYDFGAVRLCSAETGEWIGPNCTHEFIDPGIEPVKVTGLPQITVMAFPGLYNDFTPFNLTALKSASSHTLTFDAAMVIMNDSASQVLDGSVSSRILLKSCMDETVIVKLPVTGQVNALGQTEWDLAQGDLIYVKMQIPRRTTVDIYCHAESLKVMGVAAPPVLTVHKQLPPSDTVYPIYDALSSLSSKTCLFFKGI